MELSLVCLITIASFPFVPEAPPDPAYLAETRGPAVYAGCLIPFLVATIFVAGRLYSRVVILRNWGYDDAWILLSWFLALALTTVNCELVTYGSGRHIQFVLLDKNIFAVRLILAFISRILFQAVLGTTKIGTCELYLRVFQDRSSKIIVRCIEGFIALYTIALLCDIFFRCTHIPDAWLPGGTLRTCHAQIPGLYTNTACNILADILLVGFAIPRIMPLKMPKRQKIALYCIVLLSILVVIASIINITRVIHTSTSKDVTWDAFDITTWSAVEVAAGLFCTSAPAMKPVIAKLAPGFISSITTSRTNGPASYGNRENMYGSRTAQFRSRRNPISDDAIELSSEHDLYFGDQARTTNNVWHGDDNSKMSDSESERAVLGQQQHNGTKKGNIIKTTSVKVEEHVPGRTSRSDGGSSTKGFEHI